MAFLKSVVQHASRATLTALGLGELQALEGSIGALGDITFEASSFRIRTFSDMKRDSKARYATHTVIGAKPRLEYLGEDLEEVSFTMKFIASMGINPYEEGEKLRDLLRDGEAVPLTIGGIAYSQHLWIVESLGETMETVDSRGHIIVSTVEVHLKEYVPLPSYAYASGGSK